MQGDDSAAGTKARNQRELSLAGALEGILHGMRDPHARVDAAFAADPALFAMHRRRQDRLRRLQDLYRLRLDKYLDAALELFQRDEPVDELPDARDGAVQALRDLDSHHVELLQRVHEEFEEELAAHPSAALQHQRGEVAELIASCGMVAIAGGQVATLLGRLRLLDVRRHLVNKPLLAWSAGAIPGLYLAVIGAIYPLQLVRMARRKRQAGADPYFAAAYAMFMMASKFAGTVGIGMFLYRKATGSGVEYRKLV